MNWDMKECPECNKIIVEVDWEYNCISCPYTSRKDNPLFDMVFNNNK